MTGPLRGIRVVEMAGLGPAPLAAMLLADLGADVVRIDRSTTAASEMSRLDIVSRGKRSIGLDLKSPDGVALARRLIEGADVVVEGFRPGVMERLGLGPDEMLAANPRLVYGRMTGWGQEGPLAPVAGHDIGYIALTGALWAFGRQDERPSPPLNLVGDYAGGTMFLVTGIACALLERERSGHGQVVDAAMVDGVAVLLSMFQSFRAAGAWQDVRGANTLDTGAPYYEVYECADGRFLAVGALEPQFYAELVRRSGFRADLPDEARYRQPGKDEWAADKPEWEAHFRTRTRDEWAEQLAAFDTCVQPVLDWAEAQQHPHLVARATFAEHDGRMQAAPAPRFSRTPGGIQRRPPLPGEQTDELLAELGLDGDAVAALRASGVVGGSDPG